MFVIYCIVLDCIQKRENIATPSRYIFVFVNEVFNKIKIIFQLPQPPHLRSNCSRPKYSLGRYLRPWLQNISLTLAANNKKGRVGHQMRP